MRQSPIGYGNPSTDGTKDRTPTVVEGSFEEARDLRRAVNGLMARGIPTNTMRVYLVDRAGRRRRELRVESESGALKGALIGAAVGATAALIVVALIAARLLGGELIELFGVGSLLGAARAVTICAAAGVPLGALIGMGHWQLGRRVPDADFRRYNASVVVETRSMADVARQVLQDSGAHPIQVTG